MLKLLIATSTAAVIMLNGCSAPPTIGQATPTPTSRLIALQTADQSKDGTITIIREGAAQAGHCFFAVYIDGQLVARLDNNEKANFHVKPGRRLIGVGSDPQGAGACSQNSQLKREVATWLQIGESQTFRIAFLPMLDIRPSSY